jgi:hypothetical protein
MINITHTYKGTWLRERKRNLFQNFGQNVLQDQSNALSTVSCTVEIGCELRRCHTTSQEARVLEHIHRWLKPDLWLNGRTHPDSTFWSVISTPQVASQHGFLKLDWRQFGTSQNAEGTTGTIRWLFEPFNANFLSMRTEITEWILLKCRSDTNLWITHSRECPSLEAGGNEGCSHLAHPIPIGPQYCWTVCSVLWLPEQWRLCSPRGTLGSLRTP